MGIYRLNENLSVRLKALQLYIYWGALKGLNYIAYHGLLSGLDEEGAAAAEGVFHEAVAADAAQVGDGSGQCLTDGMKTN